MIEDCVLFVEYLQDTKPKQMKGDLKAYFNQLKQGMKILREMWNESPQKALGNFFGGFLLFITRNGTEFAAQLILLIVVGGFIFDGIGTGAAGIISSLGLVQETSAAGLKNGIMGFLYFLHCLDDPLMATPAIMNAVSGSLASVNGTNHINGTTSFINGTFFNTTLNANEARKQLFGTGKSFDEMTARDQTAAYRHFQNCLCTIGSGHRGVLKGEKVVQLEVPVDHVLKSPPNIETWNGSLERRGESIIAFVSYNCTAS